MKRNYFIMIVIVALLCLFLIFFTLLWEIETPVKKDVTLAPPPAAPFKTYITGVGVVEPSSGNILIGTPVNRIVQKVLVTVGQKVTPGEILFRLDNHDLQAEMNMQLAAYEIAQAKYQKLKAYPRAEDLAEAEASLKNFKVELELAKRENERVRSLPDPRALSEEEKNRRNFNYEQAEAKFLEAKIKYDKIQSGTWTPDLKIARYVVQQAKAQLERTKTEIERTLIRSPIEGTILQVNIHEGEFTPLDTSRVPLMILGDITQMNLKVSINQLDIPLFQPTAPAVAYLQGDSSRKFSLEFISIEPFVVGKQNFTNEIEEKIDTRVLKIIYRIKQDHASIFAGQLMDVFIETPRISNEK